MLLWLWDYLMSHKGENMEIKPTEQEIFAFNVLNNTCTNAQAELNRAIQGRTAYIELMENKYKAKYDPMTGQFKEEDA